MGNYFSFKGTLHFHSICFHFRSGLHNQWVINIIYHSFIEPCPKTLVGEECVRSLFPFAIKPVGDVSHINVNSMTSEQVDGSSLDWSRLTLKIWQKLGSRNGGEPWRYVRDTWNRCPHSVSSSSNRGLSLKTLERLVKHFNPKGKKK